MDLKLEFAMAALKVDSLVDDMVDQKVVYLACIWVELLVYWMDFHLADL